MTGSEWATLLWCSYLIVYLEVALHGCEAFSSVEGFKSVPSYVHVIENKALVLSWETIFNSADILMCDWSFTEEIGHPQRLFLRFDNEHAVRQNLTAYHNGWQFTNKNSPCAGGLRRNQAETSNRGIYRMRLRDTNQNQYPAYAEVQVLKDELSLYAVTIQDRNANGNIYKAQVVFEGLTSPPLYVNPKQHIPIKIKQADGLPASGVTVYQNGAAVLSFQVSGYGMGYVSYEEPCSDGNITIKIDPVIQGADSLIYYQPVIVKESLKVDCVVMIAVSIVILLVSTMMCLLIWIGWKKRWFKAKESKECEADVMLISKTIGELEVRKWKMICELIEKADQSRSNDELTTKLLDLMKELDERNEGLQLRLHVNNVQKKEKCEQIFPCLEEIGDKLTACKVELERLREDVNTAEGTATELAAENKIQCILDVIQKQDVWLRSWAVYYEVDHQLAELNQTPDLHED